MKKSKIECCGKPYWTTASACAKEIGMNRNTVESWVKKTREGALDMPIMGNPARRSHARIPVADFLEWYGYEGQN